MKSVSPALRLGSMFIDHIAVCFGMSIVVMPVLMFSIFQDFTTEHGSPIGFSYGQTCILVFVFAVYFCKDSFDGRSVAKRMLKLQVVDNAGNPAGPIRCCIRNLTIPFWPLEVVVVMFSPTRRLGDRIAGTRTIAYDSAVTKSPLNWWSVVVSLLLACAYTVILFYGMNQVFGLWQ